MSGCVFICPIGFVEPYVLDDLTACIETRCGIECAVYSPMEAPEYAYDERRCQYDSKSILKQMIKRCPRNPLGFMGVTGLDLFIPNFKVCIWVIPGARQMFPDFNS